MEFTIFEGSGDILVNNGGWRGSVAVRGGVQLAVHFIALNSTIWLSWRRPGDQKAGLQVGVWVKLKV